MCAHAHSMVHVWRSEATWVNWFSPSTFRVPRSSTGKRIVGKISSFQRHPWNQWARKEHPPSTGPAGLGAGVWAPTLPCISRTSSQDHTVYWLLLRCRRTCFWQFVIISNNNHTCWLYIGLAFQSIWVNIVRENSQILYFKKSFIHFIS